jgi:hypothetical protein
MTDEWIKIKWHIYTMEFYSVMKNEIMSFAGKMDGARDHHVKQNNQD